MAEDLMAALVRILEADTVDLRRLAEIGGSNPETFYVGTRLDGVDIRGQDLRGMKIPGLDLAKVKRDAETLLDPAPSSRPSETLLAYLAQPGFSPLRLFREFSARAYDVNERQAFLQAAEIHNGPVVIVLPRGNLADVFEVGQALEAMNVTYICVVVDGYVKRALRPARRLVSGPLPRVVFVPGSVLRGELFSGQVRDLIALLEAHWEAVIDIMPTPSCYFIRSPGRGVSSRLDAAVQIKERALVLGLETAGSGILATQLPARTMDADFDPFWSHFLKARAVAEVARAGESYRLAAFLDARREAASLDVYVTDVAAALAEKGWRNIAVERGDDLILTLPISPDGLPISVIHNGLITPPQYTTPSDGALFVDRSFAVAESVVLAPEVSLGQVVYEVLDRGVLPFNARDLLSVGTNAPSLWSLVAAQVARLSDSAYRVDQLPYLRLLIASAFSNQGVEHPDADLLFRLVRDGGEEDHLRMRASHYRQTNGGARIKLSIYTTGAAERETVAQAHLQIDPWGVRIGMRPPEPRSSAPQGDLFPLFAGDGVRQAVFDDTLPLRRKGMPFNPG